jgi:hypothetical protein
LVQRWKLDPEHLVSSSVQTGASSHWPPALQISFGAQALAQHTLAPPSVATQAPLSHSAPAPHGSRSAFFGRLQSPRPSQSAVGLHSRSARCGVNCVQASAGVAQRPATQRLLVTLGGS